MNEHNIRCRGWHDLLIKELAYCIGIVHPMDLVILNDGRLNVEEILKYVSIL